MNTFATYRGRLIMATAVIQKLEDEGGDVSDETVRRAVHLSLKSTVNDFWLEAVDNVVNMDVLVDREEDYSRLIHLADVRKFINDAARHIQATPCAISGSSRSHG